VTKASMMIELGRAVSDGKAVMLDLQTLVATRLLIQANSGGGKSYTVRRIVEQADGKIQVLIIDPEGEFSSLREKFAYIVAGKGGDVATEPRIAALLAHRLLELRVNGVLDLYEMRRMADRREFVKLFLEGLINAPKNLWHPALVVIDEAHVYCPEGKESESSDAVISLCQRGRKRGFCAVLATQRLASLSKDAAAQCGNVLIGPTTLDIDCRRAVQALALSRDKQAEMVRQMMRLDPGQFFCLGRAISSEITLTKIGVVQTHHPEVAIAGKVALGPPPPPERVKAMLPKLGDLPKEAEEEASTVAALQRRVRELTHEVAAAKRAPGVQRPDRTATEAAHTAEQVKRAVEVARRDYDRQFKSYSQRVQAEAGKMRAGLRKIAEMATQAGGILMRVPEVAKDAPASLAPLAGPSRSTSAPLPNRGLAALPTGDDEHGEGNGGKLGKGAMKMLEALAVRYPDGLTRRQLSTWSGYSRRSSTFRNNFSAIKVAGFASEEQGSVTITAEGLDEIGGVPGEPLTSERLVEMWRAKIGLGARKMLDALLDVYPAALTREKLAETTGYSRGSSTFRNNLSALRSNEIADVRGQEVRAAEALFP